MGCLQRDNGNKLLRLGAPIFNSVCVRATELVSGIALQGEGRPERKCERGLYRLENQ